MTERKQMKPKPYPKYKPSGVQWFGDVPLTWNVVALRWLSSRYAGGTPDKGNDSYWEEGTIPWINSGAVNQNLVTEPSEFITKDGYSNSSAKWISKGSLVMALAGQGKTKGMVAQLGIDTTCNQSMAAICPNKNVFARFLYWLLVVQYTQIRNMAGGEQRDGLNLDIVGDIPCLLAPVDEQQAIAEFLDRVTAKIDRLVGKQKTLIERLKEKRTALISHVVTKGLDPKVKMKPSKIPWLGDIPEHWKTMRLSYIALLKSGEGITSEEIAEGGDYPVYGGNGLRGYYSKYTHDGYYALIGRQGALCGNINYAKGKFWASEHAVAVSPLKTFAVGWIGELLRAMNLGQYSTSAAQPGLSVDLIGALKIPFPPLAEQQAIAAHLDRETGRVDTLVSKVEQAIERLQEYRTALISETVTGKIDIRGGAEK